MAVAKHNADGSLDNSFAGDGVASFPSGRDFGVARRVDFHRSDGLILAGSIREEGGYAELPYFACVDELNTKGHRKKRADLERARSGDDQRGLVAARSSC